MHFLTLQGALFVSIRLLLSTVFSDAVWLASSVQASRALPGTEHLNDRHSAHSVSQAGNPHLASTTKENLPPAGQRTHTYRMPAGSGPRPSMVYPTTQVPAQKSEYEIEREANIARNKVLLDEIGVREALEKAVGNLEKAKARPRPRPRPVGPMEPAEPLRRSNRNGTDV